MIRAISDKMQAVLLSGRSLACVLIVFAAVAWYATAILLARGAMPGLSRVSEVAIAALAVVVLCALAFALKRKAPALAAAVIRAAHPRGLWLALLLGVALRLAWVLVFDPAPSSDGLTYLQLATQLASGQPYRISGTLAYWPPGYALFLGAFLLAFPPAVVVPLTQIGLFVAAAVGVHRIADKLAGPAAATCAVALFALWPNLVAHSGTPEKELLVMTLLVWAFCAILSPRRIALFGAGLLLGGATLVQPSTMLLIPALCLLVLMRSRGAAWSMVCLMVLGAALAVAPWSLRNYEVLGSFKLVSTNGGDNLYRANNPLATGGYTAVGAVDLSGLPELERDRTAKALAVQWMREHPLDFATLALEKQIRFMGDDAAGIFTTFRAEGEQRSNRLYLPLKMAANLWWLAAWLCIAALLMAGARLGAAAFLVWGWIYLFSLHSVFESAGKYHVPMLWIPCVLVGILMADAARRLAAVRAPLAQQVAA